MTPTLRLALALLFLELAVLLGLGMWAERL